MTVCASRIRIWLLDNFRPVMSAIHDAQIFGSLAAGCTEPSDCDLLLVARVESPLDEWVALRGHISSLKDRFNEEFGLPLSVTLLTLAEWNELEGFFGSSRLSLFSEED